MNLPSDPALLDRFERRDGGAGIAPDGSFAYRLDLDRPYLVTAIHAGHRIRDELRSLLAMDEAARRFEEDAATEEIIGDRPSVLWALDSRAEYDLNRSEAEALPLTPQQFWGQRVYHTTPDDGMNRRSLARHAAFYTFVGTYLSALLHRHGRCVVYDIHSYNISRQQQKGIHHPPAFNLGTALLDRSRWGPAIDAWLQALKAIRLPGQKLQVAENLVFQGRGEFCRRLTRWDPNILVLPTEIAKIYMDEHTGERFPDVIARLKTGLRQAVEKHSRYHHT